MDSALPFSLLLLGLPVLLVWLPTVLLGTSVGGLILGTRIERPDGRKPNLLQATVRTLVYFPSFFLMGLPAARALVGPRHLALHDWVSGTRVVASR